MISVLVMVAITPLVGVYIFSVEFINRGIDNWLNVDVERGMSDALDLSQTRRSTFRRAASSRKCSSSRASSPIPKARLAAEVERRCAQSSEARRGCGLRPNNQLLGINSRAISTPTRRSIRATRSCSASPARARTSSAEPRREWRVPRSRAAPRSARRRRRRASRRSCRRRSRSTRVSAHSSTRVQGAYRPSQRAAVHAHRP